MCAVPFLLQSVTGLISCFDYDANLLHYAINVFGTWISCSMIWGVL